MAYAPGCIWERQIHSVFWHGRMNFDLWERYTAASRIPASSLGVLLIGEAVHVALPLPSDQAPTQLTRHTLSVV